MKLTRRLDRVEVDCLKTATDHPIPVGGVLDETLEMLCNSYGLLEQEYLNGETYPLGGWVITETGRAELAKYKHDQPCDRCGHMFLRGTLARRYWNETNQYLCKECLQERGEEVDPIDYNFQTSELADLVARFTTAIAEIEALKARIAEMKAGEVMLLRQVGVVTGRAETAHERASKYGSALDAIRHEVMQYPMDAPAGELIDLLDRMTRQG